MCNRENLESTLIDINKIINFDKDRKSYTFHYSELRNRIFKNLKKNPEFNRLSKGLYLEGSYGDNLKVVLPNEFDLVFGLEFPENNKIIVQRDNEIAGNVRLNMTEVINALQSQNHNAPIYTLLKKNWVDKENYLLEDRLQIWLNSLFLSALREMDYKINVHGNISKLKYNRKGPAHNIEVIGHYEYSVDFVPGIMLDTSKRVTKKSGGNWQAIPKPLKPQVPHNRSFRASYYSDETKIIADNYNFKNALRMVKKFREAHKNMENLKSYYIKTLFLQKYSLIDISYWRKPLSIIVTDMFADLAKCLEDHRLLDYWDNKLNYLKQFNSTQIIEMLKCVQKAQLTLKKSQIEFNLHLKKRIYNIFLTRNELSDLELIRSFNKVPPAANMTNDDTELAAKAEQKSTCILS